MEGNLKVEPGDVLMAGYDFTMPGKHLAATDVVHRLDGHLPSTVCHGGRWRHDRRTYAG